ncbi:MAG: penicillin acylase family protein [Deltaproteobacteria bacterium]|nr:penicillin acylase family protein [Deltaproteobacteria bacterium]MBW1929323.1 penicillin acylase family protein [Deltaproteobacteria bacterium]MBW2025137.1 penicillin acylase family protein [Deltaproteobacteria bacterium]MBW2126236.1 penicillin acylase family protein [Deltaproteobacteria bacterium]
MSIIENALHVLPTGESGLLKSPHYKDQIPLYLGGKYHPAWSDESQVKKNKEGELVLKPLKG